MEAITRVVTAEQMKQIERNAAESGLSYFQMMDNAGMQASHFIKDKITKWIFSENIIVFCGKGNNGGDGFVVAREFAQCNAKITVVLVDGETLTEDASRYYQVIKAFGVPIKNLPEDQDEIAELVATADTIVDAIYGTGFHGSLNDNARIATTLINSSGAEIYSLDIPSGVNADTGETDRDAVKAKFTIAFDSYKPVHQMKNKATYCGEVVCVDIGIKEACHNL